MNFKWDMTETNWKNYMRDHKGKKTTNLSNDADVYGSVNIGKLRVEFCHTLDLNNWYPYAELFCLDRATGYGITENGRNYDLLNNHISIPVRCKSFESFKLLVEQRILEEISAQNLTGEAEAKNGWSKVA